MLRLRRYFVLSLTLMSAACVVSTDAEDCRYDEEFACYLEYTPGYGYERVCEWTVDPLICVDLDDDDDYQPRYTRYPRGSVSAGGSSSSGGSASGGEEPSTEVPPEPPPGVGTEIPCTRDGQCGTGVCSEGLCFYGCVDASECGTGDVCEAVAGISVCQAPGEPEVQCTRSAECGNEQVCLNAVCHDSCEVTSDCSNALDRCVDGICLPDRSIVSECLLDRECAEGQVCIDASCQQR
jgi:hypothetical protein